EDAHAARLPLPQQAAQLTANEAVQLSHVGGRWCHAGSDRPDRLVSDHGIAGAGLVRQRSLQLASHHLQGLAVLAFFSGLPNTDDGGETSAIGGARLGADECIGLAMIYAALGMADDDG